MFEFKKLLKEELDDLVTINEDLVEQQAFDLNKEVEAYKVIKQEEIKGFLFKQDKRCLFYENKINQFVSNAILLDDNNKVIDLAIGDGKEYVDDPTKHDVKIIISDEIGTPQKLYSLGFEKDINDGKEVSYVNYSVADCRTAELVSYTFPHSYIGPEIGKRNPIIKSRIKMPDAYFYEKGMFLKKREAYIKVDEYTTSWMYIMAILTESKDIGDFINKYKKYKSEGFPYLERYIRAYCVQDNYYKIFYPFISYLTKSEFLENISSDNLSSVVSDELLDLYNRDLDLINNYQLLINDYLNVSKELKLIKK